MAPPPGTPYLIFPKTTHFNYSCWCQYFITNISTQYRKQKLCILQLCMPLETIRFASYMWKACGWKIHKFFSVEFSKLCIKIGQLSMTQCALVKMIIFVCLFCVQLLLSPSLQCFLSLFQGLILGVYLTNDFEFCGMLIHWPEIWKVGEEFCIAGFYEILKYLE